MSKIVAIVGRPNVGKSTLFNRMTESRAAIVNEESGVTRDRHYGRVIWNGVDFSVIDTGGFVENSDDVFESEINRQVKLAISEADVILFMVDVETGIHELDRSVAEMLRKVEKPVVTVVNKVDNNQRLLDAAEFYGLGLGDYFCVSSVNGSGTGDLLDEIVKHLPDSPEEPGEDIPRVAVVGRPNVGKSSLTNTLLGEERNIVTPVAGTTRDSIHSLYNKFNNRFLLIDTAGLRKKAKVDEDIEFYSILRAVRSIEESDLCLLLIDATRGLESQDLSIMSIIQKNNKGMILLVNKWDLIEKDQATTKKLEEEIRYRTAPFTDYPILFISAITKQRVHKVLELIMTVYENRKRKIPTSQLNEVMLKFVNDTPPPSLKGKHIKIKYVTQLPAAYPTFAFFCNFPQYIKDPYKRFVENRLRESFPLTGAPVKIFFRKK
ncbi:MAG: ribosome biogenesis GTPase Der [Bacteroidales bacterium]|jgi:GTP-binding protein|nr:ribosome biogenesis GTPase Der [Bacteroidales bacterium]